MSRTRLEDRHIKRAFDEIRAAFNVKMRSKGEHALCSTHECLGVTSEEFDELAQAVKYNDLELFEEELIDVGVCVILSLASKYSDSLEW